MAISTAIIAAATTLAAPRSEPRLDGRHRLRADRDARQQDRACTDPGHHEPAVATQRQLRPRRPTSAYHVRGGALVTTGGQPCGLSRRVDAPHLHADRGEPADAQHQDHRQRGDRERRLDGDTTPVIT